MVADEAVLHHGMIASENLSAPSSSPAVRTVNEMARGRVERLHRANRVTIMGLQVAAHVQEVATLAEVANELWTVPASPHSHAT